MVNTTKQKLTNYLQTLYQSLYNVQLPLNLFELTATRKDFEGDWTLVVFPLLKAARKRPEELAKELGEALVKEFDFIESFEVVKGFLNIKLKNIFWTQAIKYYETGNFEQESESRVILIEFPAPNTNKPLHLGHIRNALLGESLSRIAEAVGNRVYRINLINDRGIHICKSMLAWKKWGNGITPEQAGKKGDHLVGDFYVLFEKKLKEQTEELISKGLDKEQAINEASLMKEARQMLRDWEEGNEEVLRIWKMMNDWVLKGFDETFEELGIRFDKIYYESETYEIGRRIINDNYEKGLVSKNKEGAIYIDLTDKDLGEKILLRSDGTAVYITQDIANAVLRFEEFNFDKHFYVVANEQIYHFQVLREVLKRFGYQWYDRIFHYAYGMVELPEGKMKSREGKVVDADDLIREMYQTAEKKTFELGKLQGIDDVEKQAIIKKIGLGALKYFILKVDPKKNMLFNPNESIDFEGNTGPFIQYSYTRINSLLNKAKALGIHDISDFSIDFEIYEKEKILLKRILDLENVVFEAYKSLMPSVLANYAYQLAKDYNSFYQEFPILKAEQNLKKFRLTLSKLTGNNLKFVLNLLGIDVPDRM